MPEALNAFFDFYSKIIEPKYLRQQLQYKGSKQVGGNYINKVRNYQTRSIQSCYDSTLESVKNPTFSSFFQDNLFRFLLNPFDRLVAAYQAYPTLKARFSKPGTFSYTFTEIMNQGLIFGAFKGAVFNFAQLAFVLYPSVYFANKSTDSKYFTFLSSYIFLDTLFYPLDTLKNILYADTVGQFNLKTVFNSTGILNLYNGLLCRISFNVPYLTALYTTTQVDNQSQALLWWAATALLYPFNTLKVRSQVQDTVLSSFGQKALNASGRLYRGVVPFILLNALIGYTLRPLFSADKLKQIQSGVRQSLSEAGLA